MVQVSSLSALIPPPSSISSRCMKVAPSPALLHHIFGSLRGTALCPHNGRIFVRLTRDPVWLHTINEIGQHGSFFVYEPWSYL